MRLKEVRIRCDGFLLSLFQMNQARERTSQNGERYRVQLMCVKQR